MTLDWRKDLPGSGATKRIQADGGPLQSTRNATRLVTSANSCPTRRRLTRYWRLVTRSFVVSCSARAEELICLRIPQVTAQRLFSLWSLFCLVASGHLVLMRRRSALRKLRARGAHTTTRR